MKCHIANKEHIAFGSNFESYFDQKHPPDCSLFSQDNYEFQVHKEILFQTKYLRKMVISLNTDSCKGKIKFKFRAKIRRSSNFGYYLLTRLANSEFFAYHNVGIC